MAHNILSGTLVPEESHPNSQPSLFRNQFKSRQDKVIMSSLPFDPRFVAGAVTAGSVVLFTPVEGCGLSKDMRKVYMYGVKSIPSIFNFSAHQDLKNIG